MLWEDVLLAEKKAQELKSELEANKLKQSDPWFKEYSEYVELVNNVLSKTDKAKKDLDKIQGKLDGLIKELEGHKDKVLTKADIEWIIK